MNSVVSFLSSFVFGLHLVMNPWRLGDIVQVSFCFIWVCIWQVCLQFPKGFFFFFFFSSILRNTNWGGGGENKKGRYFSVLKTGGGPTVQEAAVIVFPFKEADGMDGTSFIKCGFLQSPHVSHLGESHFGKLSVHQIRRRLVQFLSHFTPAFLKSVKKRALCFLFKESYTEIHLYGIHMAHLCHSWVAIGYTGQCWWRCWWIPDFNIQTGVLGKGWRPFIFHFLSLSKT